MVPARALLAVLAAAGIALASGIGFTGPVVLSGEVPVIDAPYNWQSGLYAPSMAQVVGVSNLFHEAAFFGAAGLADALTRRPVPNILTRDIAGAAFLVASANVPFGLTWAHEEFHRAVLHNRGVNSYDDVYNFPFFSTLVSVSRVSDSALERLKANYPADLVRAHEAGYEAQQQVVAALERGDFFHDRLRALGLNQFYWWYSDVENIAYVGLCTSAGLDSLTDRLNREEGANVAKRDFTGFDFTAWTYDLFRPDEPYAARGVHPSGVGINRYIKHSDLTAEEQRWLEREFVLSFASLVDPMLIGFGGVAVGGAIANARLTHHLTSFGHSMDVNVLLRRGDAGLAVTLASQQNRVAYFPGLRLDAIGWPVGSWQLSPSIAFWLQPRDQRADAHQSVPGVLVSLRADYPVTGWLRAGAEVEAKTRGWVAGNVYLDQSVSVRTWLSVLVR